MRPSSAPGGLRLGVLASGRGSDLQSLIDANVAGKIQSRVVVVGSDVPSAPALERARRHDIPAGAVTPDVNLKGDERRREHDGRVLALLTENRVDAVVLAGYMRLVGPALLAKFPQKVVNIHPALLPAFPGLHGQKQALDWGARVAGCTTHFVDAEVDHGPIILQAALSIDPRDDETALSQKILAVEHQLLPRTVHLLEQGRLRIEGRRVRIDADASWAQKYPVLPGVLYGTGY